MNEMNEINVEEMTDCGLDVTDCVADMPDDNEHNWVVLAVAGGILTIAGVAFAGRKKIKEWVKNRKAKKNVKVNEDGTIESTGEIVDENDDAE